MASEITVLCVNYRGYTFLIDEQEQGYGSGGGTVHQVMTVVAGVKHVFAMDPVVFRNPALRDSTLQMFVMALEGVA